VSSPVPPWRRRLLHYVGLFALVGYLGWNVWWLAQGRVPPAIFKALTGYPAPTTGGTRSARFLLAGDWQESLRANAMTVPIAVLFVVTLVWPAVHWVRKGRPRLPLALAWVWAVVLLIAWVLKLTGDPQYW
jgi:hypothetical protein